MENTGYDIVNNLKLSGYEKLAALWKPFIEDGCTIYIPSGTGYTPMDGYAMHSLVRYFPPTVDLDIIPVYGYLREVVNTRTSMYHLFSAKVRHWFSARRATCIEIAIS